ncbi:PIN domain-containing protein [Mycetohabitans endofungorum]|uniref:PIN domain-containing protein n=1 Tax=Mycetohabitans endofungorum TaxID=417203 RepID=UPI002B055A88|nr:PIN domain-containing protein [Mycetohabitans endofungorum]
MVLDTNVWIDILVFDDPATRPIATALQDGSLDAVQDDRCLNELQRVLDYPQFVRYAIDQPAALARLARLCTHVAPALRTKGGAAMSVPEAGANARASTHAAGAAPRALPLCRDRDDQKFLELAYDTAAQWLVTKDKALLKMARRMAREFDLRIVQPAQFVAAAGLAQSAAGDATHEPTVQ